MTKDKVSKLVRYGKPSGPLIKLKASFFDENEALLSKSLILNKIYAQQPRRNKCKCCNGDISKISFTKLGIDYLICPRCSHLNGAHEDTDAYCATLYTDDGGTDYAASYGASDAEFYRQRVEDIYLPKANFLLEALISHGWDPMSLSYSDFGAGSGYFVSALLNKGLSRVSGFEVSQSQTALASKMIGSSVVRCHGLGETASLMSRTDSDVVCMIGVLEHLQRPREILKAVTGNPSVKFIYISVPLFSACVFFEMMFPTVMQRQLADSHTHLYTDLSLDWMCKEFGLERIAEWWFGTDMVDLYRDVLVRLSQAPETANVAKTWSDVWVPVIDNVQLQLDQRRMSSEVHLLLRVIR